jgi:hypothetical protein
MPQQDHAANRLSPRMATGTWWFYQSPRIGEVVLKVEGSLNGVLELELYPPITCTDVRESNYHTQLVGVLKDIANMRVDEFQELIKSGVIRLLVGYPSA